MSRLINSMPLQRVGLQPLTNVMWFRALRCPFSTCQASRLSLHPIRRPFSSHPSLKVPKPARKLQDNGLRPLKNTASVPKQAKQAGKKLKYPERLLIYHAGVGRIVFIGILKVTTLIIFAAFCFVAAPANLYSPEEPKWIAAAAALTCGLIPLIFVTYTTTPFVAFIHLRLPAYARTSSENLHRFTATLPPTSDIDITTINIIGRQRIHRMPISQLYPAKSRFGIGDYARKVNEKEERKRRWWVPRPPMVFGVDSRKGSGVMKEEGVWGEVRRVIEQGSGGGKGGA